MVWSYGAINHEIQNDLEITGVEEKLFSQSLSMKNSGEVG